MMLDYVLLPLWLALACVVGQLPTPCTDLRPVYFLYMLADHPMYLPPGVQIVYDDEAAVHAFKLTQRAHTLRLPATPTIFKYCGLFPEEFSVLSTFKMEDSTQAEIQCLLALMPSATHSIQFGVRLQGSAVLVDYYDRVTSRTRVVKFPPRKGDTLINDGHWHTIIISVAGTSVLLRVDCGTVRVKRLRRTFPAMLSTIGTDFHIMNCNRQNSMFTGSIKQLLLLPGSDASYMACPSANPTLPEISHPPTSSQHLPHMPLMYHNQPACGWQDTGELWFDTHAHTLNVCHSGLWQPIQTQSTTPLIRESLDYIVWYQDIVTASPAIDIETFTIPDEGHFMAVASYNSENVGASKQQSTIFKWENGSFKIYQSLLTEGAQSWEYFQIGKQFYLSVANFGTERTQSAESVVYRWSKKNHHFRVHQTIVTWSARDMEHFEIDEDHYLAVANHLKGHTHTIDSVIYKWSREHHQFLEYQRILTTGAYDWTFFSAHAHHFLIVANAFTGEPESTTKLYSSLYVWHAAKFKLYQNIETTGATDWESFELHGEFYLAVANAFNYGAHTTVDTKQYQTNSTIYRLNPNNQKFEVYQQLLTNSIIDWESVHIGSDCYLLASNAQHNTESPRDQSSSNLYRWQGAETFVLKHQLRTHPSADWEACEIDGEIYLILANANDNISQMYKVIFK